MGVWIEIHIITIWLFCHQVTPFMGVWIEIVIDCIQFQTANSHSLYGSVD